MKKLNILRMAIAAIVILSTGISHASYHAQAVSCDRSAGKVISVVNNETFEIEVCGKPRVYREFSYCFEVEQGDMVRFEWDPAGCDYVSFTVLRNGVYCGVLCP